MLTPKDRELKHSDDTPKRLYLGRRNFLLGLLAATASAGCGGKSEDLPSEPGRAPVGSKLSGVIKGPYGTSEAQTPYNNVTHYNNFYEFGTDKSDPANNAKNFVTSPWSVSVEGEVKNPRKVTMGEILMLAPLEERIYRHRCVEAWSIVVPWIGYSFSVLAKLVEPTSNAKYVAFQSYYDVKQTVRWHRVALCGGIADGRSDAPADAADGRNVRRHSSEPGWRARARGGPVEIRLQEHQIAGQDSLRSRSTADHMESRECERVWLLFQRESQR